MRMRWIKSRVCTSEVGRRRVVPVRVKSGEDTFRKKNE